MRVHSTTRDAASSSHRIGINRMNRNNIHFASSMSSVRSGSSVLVHLDVRKYARAGFPLYRLRNGIVASGITKGYVRPTFLEENEYI